MSHIDRADSGSDKPQKKRLPRTYSDAFDIPAFCSAHAISRSTFYNPRRDGKAPRLMRVGSRVLISKEAAADWRRARESAA